jgi:hypothetical protein
MPDEPHITLLSSGSRASSPRGRREHDARPRWAAARAPSSSVKHLGATPLRRRATPRKRRGLDPSRIRSASAPLGHLGLSRPSASRPCMNGARARTGARVDGSARGRERAWTGERAARWNAREGFHEDDSLACCRTYFVSWSGVGRAEPIASRFSARQSLWIRALVRVRGARGPVETAPVETAPVETAPVETARERAREECTGTSSGRRASWQRR